jgi:hypothetical protein
VYRINKGVKIYMECQKEQRGKPIVKVRTVLKVGSSYYISIPPEFMKRHDIKKGDKLPVVAGQIMKVIPMGE